MAETDKIQIIENVYGLLFRHPLYNRCDEANEMKLLVVGDGDYARLFVDAVLQIGQMADKDLVVCWCTADEETKEAYLKERPALKDFIRIIDNRSNAGVPGEENIPEKNIEAYATLIFDDIPGNIDEYNADCRYFFAACGDDQYNEEAATRYIMSAKENCIAAYVVNDAIEVKISREADDAEYEEANETLDKASDKTSPIGELQRMALNTHLTWEGPGNMDYENAVKRYENPYNRNSSAAFVLSIPYKLRSIGIKETDPYKAAAVFHEILSKEEEADSGVTEILGKMACLEHRRWILEKVTFGVSGITNPDRFEEYDKCIKRASLKKTDENGRLIMHPCVARSTEATPLLDGIFKDRANWDDSSVPTDGLDDLDRLSIELHRAMLTATKRIKARIGDKPKEVEPYRSLHGICKSDNSPEQVKRDYDRYNFCIENILGGNTPYAGQFETYEKDLKKSLYELSEEDRAGAEKLMEQIKKELFPVLECIQYRDYKEFDISLLRSIPYILTAKNDIHICMPMGEASCVRGNNDDFFTSVASLTALYANKVTYLYLCEKQSNSRVFEAKIRAIRNYLNYRGKTCDIDIKLFFRDTPEDRNLRNKLQKKINIAMKEEIIQGHSLHVYTDENLGETVAEAIKDSGIDYFDGSVPISRSSMLNAQLINHVSARYPYFEFDSYQKCFRNCRGCEYLQYMRITSFLQVEDMFALFNAHDKQFNYPGVAGAYSYYWKIFNGDAIGEEDFALCARCWTQLCDIFKTGGADAVEIELTGTKGQNGKNSSKDGTTISKIVEVVERGSEKGIDLTKEQQVIIKMIRAMESRRYIELKTISQKGRIRVIFRNRKMKKIFAKSGELLETYVYFEACRTAYFDDVQTGYQFKWENGEVSNELDCVLTKDYRSIIVECKSAKSPDEDFYLILDSLANQFGIGYKKVLVMVTDTTAKNYDSYVLRGEQLEIITISEKEDLDNIGQKLIEIMERAW